jgi:hypothetical protein
MVAGSTGSLKVAVTVVPMPTAEAPPAGETAVTVGGVVSAGPGVVLKTTSTQ